MTEAQHIGTRIRALRKAKGLTLQQVADTFGISRASVSEWESGRSKPDAAKLTNLAGLLDTSIEYLLTGKQPNLILQGALAGGTHPITSLTGPFGTVVGVLAGAASGVTKLMKQKNVDETVSNVTEWPVGKLPLISWVQAGDWSEIVDNFQPGDAEDWIACPFPSGRHGFVLRVVGDSMYNPGGDLSFRDGDFISVNPEHDARHRSLVIARRDREKATFKQLLLDESEGPMLHALNPNWPTRYIPFDKNTEIVGVVTGQWRPLV
ncbi:helix-turn-helix domain-containing protein [Burkholderia vietnamiensis]|uniref:helix-turn-helix domain-containing protein n=1 Tax=Burkholderia vietnamiensis TaxID=60552 RepID=UPI00104160ED|nr:XRE family transcriptional regulator [Burkholderia vietnamiensis]